jgi:hypothetical protein
VRGIYLLEIGSGGHCSPRHMMPFNPRRGVSRCVGWRGFFGRPEYMGNCSYKYTYSLPHLISLFTLLQHLDNFTTHYHLILPLSHQYPQSQHQSQPNHPDIYTISLKLPEYQQNITNQGVMGDTPPTKLPESPRNYQNINTNLNQTTQIFTQSH